MFIVIGIKQEKGIEKKLESVAKQFGGESKVVYFEPPDSPDRFTLVNECRSLVKEIAKKSRMHNPVSIVGQMPHITYNLSAMLAEEGYPLFSILERGKVIQYA